MRNEQRVEFVKQRIVEKLGVQADRFGHIKFRGSDGQEYRYKFQQNTIRKEVRVRYEASQYSPASSQWIRLKTYNIKKAYENMVAKKVI